MSRKVHGPDGTRWTVGRRWTEGFELPRWRGKDPGGLDALGGVGDLGDAGPLAVIGVVIALVLLVVLFAVVAVPLLFFGVELVIVLVVVLAGLVGRLVLGHPWLVEARTGGRVVESLRIGGWRASLDAVEQLRSEVASGLVRVPAPQPTSTGPTDAAPPRQEITEEGVGERELLLRATIALVLSCLWLGGIGSVLALLGASSVLEESERPPVRAAAWVAIVLGFLGILLTIALAIGIANDSIRLT